MEMNITLRQVEKIYPALQNLASRELPAEKASMTYCIGKNLEQVERELPAYQKARSALIRKFATEKVDQPGAFEVPPASREAYEEALNSLLDQEVSIRVRKVDLKDYPVQISPLEVANTIMFWNVPPEWDKE